MSRNDNYTLDFQPKIVGDDMKVSQNVGLRRFLFVMLKYY